MKLINKSAVVAEIERLKSFYGDNENIRHVAKYNVLALLVNFLDTLEVKEVDLEKELDEWMKYGPHTNYPWCTIPDAIKITAEHFFELGLKAQKGE